MRPSCSWFAVVIIGLAAGPAPVRADHVLVRLGDLLIPMEGKVADPTARIMTVTHEKFRNLKLNLYYRNPSELISVENVIYVPTRKAQYEKQFVKAQKGTTADRMEAAAWAIKYGMVPEFYRAIELAIQSEPNHAQAK